MGRATLPRRAKRQTGASLTELLVGTAVGLSVVASTTTLSVQHLDQARRQALDSRLQQDLRHAADLITRELRRSGHWGLALEGAREAAADGSDAALPAAPPRNPYAAFTTDTEARVISFALSREAVENSTLDRADRSGFRWNRADRSLQMLTPSGAWHTLTDPAVSVFDGDGFALSTRVTQQPAPEACAEGCTGLDCPQVSQRTVTLVLRARSARDAQVQRELRTQVQLRNDVVTGQCPA